MAYPTVAIPGLVLPGSVQPAAAGIIPPPRRPSVFSSSAPGAAQPAAMMPASLGIDFASAALSAGPRMLALASEGPDPARLWVLYTQATLAAANAWETWRMMRQAGGTDGSAGMLYGKAYQLQNAADAAYTAYLQAQAAVSGVRG